MFARRTRRRYRPLPTPSALAVAGRRQARTRAQADAADRARRSRTCSAARRRRCASPMPIRQLPRAARTVETHGQRMLWRNCRRWTTRSTPARRANTASPGRHGQATADCRSELLAADEALVYYFITRKWQADRESADPFEDERLYAIVWRKDEEPRLHDLGDPREIIPSSRPPQMASLRSTRSTERGAISIAEMGDVFAGLHGRLIAPLEPTWPAPKPLRHSRRKAVRRAVLAAAGRARARCWRSALPSALLTRPESLLRHLRRPGLAKSGQRDARRRSGLLQRSGEGRRTIARHDAGGRGHRRRCCGNDSFSIDMLTGDEAAKRAAQGNGNCGGRASGDPRRLPSARKAAPATSTRCGRATSSCRNQATGTR